ncbi:haloacid dehalogenase [Mycobacterium talmoniae]|uniref:Haloacid dehalogenase n=1 Tax=Mycobacterium talmoniae TaxID=1858794 RepID=A0A1S1ND09_9MYCO|nr:haloacid dehalogenase [Mycobacterium talmoniae]
MQKLLPLRAVEKGFQAAAGAVGAVAVASVDLATMPLREGAKLLSGEASVSSLARRCWRGDSRAWIEVRGLSGPDGAERGRVVIEALAGRAGVTSVSLNRPLSRVVVELDGDHALSELCAVVADAEKQVTGSTAAHTRSLPGDGLLLATRGALVGVNAVGVAVAVVGRTLRLPAAPVAVDAVAALANYQPWVRRLLEDRIGAGATDTVLSLVSATAHIATLSPFTLSVDLATHGLKAAEVRAAAQAWSRHEPQLARHADHPDFHQVSRPVPAPAGPAERHGQRVAFVQAVGAGLVGVLTRNVAMASSAATVTAPKALRTTRESFAATLGQGLADEYAILPLRPDALRRLDKVDAILIDPRVLCDETLRVVSVRGAGDHQLSAAWEKAQNLLDKPGLKPGWHRIPRMRGAGSNGSGPDAAVEALIAPAHHRLAAEVLAQARASGSTLVSVDGDALGELRTAFDEVRDIDGGLDDALAAAVADLQRDGRTVAVLSAVAGHALAGADVALGVLPSDDSAPPWQADLMLPDLAGAWQVLRALPAARTASQRGITLSASASALGAVLMVPGIRLRQGRGPGPVTLGAAAGLLSGYLLARRVVRTPAPRPAPAYEWHAMSVEQVRAVLPPPDSDAPAGATVGAQSPHALWQFAKAVRAELSDPLTPIMAVGSAATAILGSPIDAVMVGFVLIGNAMLAAGQQMRAENRLNVLLAQQTPLARKVTDETYTEVMAEQLQPGDVIEVRSNEVVPADARIIEAIDLEVDESSLTGESLSVDKQTESTPGAELAERSCMLYAGTTVVAGTAVALVTAVGPDTQTRRAAELASGDLPVVGLQHQLSKLMYRAFPVSAGGGVLVGALGLLRGGGLRQALGDAIAIAVAAVPEGMPLMATLAQYASARRLTGTGALVRVPRSVEALGRIDVVCFDKTGTLSENRLRVTQVHPVAGHTDDDVLRCAVHAAPAPEGTAHAHATDQAIIEAAAKAVAGTSRPQPDAHLPFRSGRAFSASVTGAELTIKGAPEVVLAACDDAGAAGDTVPELAASGLRVIAVARRTLTAAQMRSLRDDPDSITDLCGAGLSLTGFLGIADTPREAAPQLLADLADRGVDIRLITGDHPVTATAIAAELGVSVDADEVITGSEWNALSRKDQERVVCERVIFARMSPENKVQIVQTLERAGRVCAMVGDGANDAAAIRVATVGIGVVARGSDSAHTIADVVLTDGRIGALVDAIDEGRRLWRGVQAAVSGLLGGNAGEVIFAVIGTALTGTSPLNTRQLLLMNTLTDALPATAVAVSTPRGPVQRVGHGIDERRLWRAVGVRGAITAAAATTAWGMASVTGRPQRAATVALIALVSVELGQTLVDSHAPLVVLTAAGSFAAFALMVSTPGVSQLLGCTPVGPVGWAQALGPAAAATAAVAATTHLSDRRRELPVPASPESPAPRPATAARTPRAAAPPTAASSRKSADRQMQLAST